MVDWILISNKPVNEPVKETYELCGVYVIIPFSNSQAHHLAEKYTSCRKLLVDVQSIREFIKVIKEVRK